MENSFLFKNVAKSEEEKLREYWAKKLPKIEKLLSHFAPDAVTLQLKAEYFEKHSAYKIDLILKIPSGTLSAEEISHAFTKAVDLALDRLVMQLKKNSIQFRRAHRSIKARRTVKQRTQVAEHLTLASASRS